MTKWIEKFEQLYGLDPEQKLDYWYGELAQDKKKEFAAGGFKRVDEILGKLFDKGYRVVKSSAITPRGIYDKYNLTAQESEPAANNLFFEQKFNAQEFMDLYDKVARFENNFPIYFDGSAKSYQNYAQKSDIYVLERIRDNKALGLASFQLIEAGTPEADDMKDSGFPVKDKLIYHDTVAISSELQGAGVGKLFCEALDAYNVACFGADQQYILCTGKINFADNKKLAREFHTARGYGTDGAGWIKHTGTVRNWLNRWNQDNIEQRGQQIKTGMMLKSYTVSR